MRSEDDVEAALAVDASIRAECAATRCGCDPAVADYVLRRAIPRLNAGTVCVVTRATCCGKNFADELTIAQVHAISRQDDE